MNNENKLNLVKRVDVINFNQSKMLNVPSPAIHIENSISLTQKKIWFELIYYAFPNMGQRKYSISLNRLRDILGWNDTTSNDKELKEALYDLNKTVIEWNIFNKDKKNVWQCFPLLAGCEIVKNSGVCTYSLSPFLEERFLSMGQEAYVKIDLIVSKKFQSKYSLSIYCLALDYLIMERGYSEKKFTLEELRKYLGIKDDEYILTANFNDRVINVAEKEINQTSDMNIEIKPYKEGRKIAGYKLCTSLKEGRIKDYLEKKERFKQISSTNQIIDNLVNEIIEIPRPKLPAKIIVENIEVKKFLLDNSISITTDTIQKRLIEIKEGIENDIEGYLLFLMNYSKKEIKKGNIKSLSGFFVGLLKDDTQITNFLFNKEQELNKKMERERIIDRNIKLELKSMYEQYLNYDFKNFIISNIHSLEDKIMQYAKENFKVDTFYYDVIIKRYMNNKFSIQSFLSLPTSHQSLIINEFSKNQDYFGYKLMSSSEWESIFATEQLINSVREEIISQKKL
jgi:hypothetical protein